MAELIQMGRKTSLIRGLMMAAVISVSLAGTGVARAESAAEQSAGYTGEETPDGASMMVDLLLARPVGVAATLIGTTIFVVGLPFEALSGDVSGPAKKLVVEPAKYAFTRPLGQVE